MLPLLLDPLLTKSITCIIAQYVCDTVIYITVRALNGNKMECKVLEHEETARSLKAVVAQREGICIGDLRLIFKGKIVNDTDVLWDVGVRAGMTLMSAIMLRGS